ncbi:MAG TPA: hypothetical protein VGF77_18060 [Allosphingosinicella sp.]
MAISAGQAAAALEEIERTERRTHVSGGYRAASPYLILWGCIWAVGYAGCGFFPAGDWGWIWLPLIVVGIGVSVWFGSRATGARSAKGAANGWQASIMALAVMLFIGATCFIFRVADPLPYLVFPALVTGLVYVFAGLLAGLPRLASIGAAVFLLPLAGYIAAPALTAYWVAAAGGGGLILGGLWLRQV